LKLDAEFICSDVYSIERSNPDPYQVVFTSHETTCWLPDLKSWAEVVTANLALDGQFYIAEFQPSYDLLAGYSYFTREQPDVDEGGTYTENAAEAFAKWVTWAHPMPCFSMLRLRPACRLSKSANLRFCWPDTTRRLKRT